MESNFLILSNNMKKIHSLNNGIYIFGGFYINFYLNASYILAKKIVSSKLISSDVKSYHKSCAFFGFKQLIKVQTRVTSSSFIIIDHILARYPERLTQHGVINIGLPDHQFIYYIKKSSRIKRGYHKQLKFRSFKHCTADLFEQELSKLDFPNYQSYNDMEGELYHI